MADIRLFTKMATSIQMSSIITDCQAAISGLKHDVPLLAGVTLTSGHTGNTETHEDVVFHKARSRSPSSLLVSHFLLHPSISVIYYREMEKEKEGKQQRRGRSGSICNKEMLYMYNNVIALYLFSSLLSVTPRKSH